ncbi:LOW QUALITY PROTEIN: hypothetical protein Dda_3220 [Drechslerella dactyloides]|uniref:Uncharacterized protein n=1 Tax=Drechslerella dactyloides TaxID=74499 RepID=A0AAD6J263_DREDA|nr:LOW QUALITY PROTEIN: hypothetical protein Dda_3220 [Drechslerella dactyloides]
MLCTDPPGRQSCSLADRPAVVVLALVHVDLQGLRIFLRGAMRLLLQLLLPQVIRPRRIDGWENDVEHLRVPADRLAFEAFLDILPSTLPLAYSYIIEKGYKGEEGVKGDTSSQSDMLSAGKITVDAPLRFAATVFSRNPPIRSTLPVTVNSPVIATLNRLVAIVIPAEGPSFGTAPSGQCRCTRAFSRNRFSGNVFTMKDLANEYAIAVDSFITFCRLPVRSRPGRESESSADSKRRAAELRPCEAHRDARWRSLVESVAGVDWRADVVFQVVPVDGYVDGVGDFEWHARGFGCGGLRVRSRVCDLLGLFRGLLLCLLAFFRERLVLGEDVFADVLHDLQRRLAVADTALATVALDQLLHRVLRQVDIHLIQPAERLGLRRQIPLRNRHLLVGNIPAQLDHLHAVQQRPRDRIRHVGRAHEQHLAQIHGHVHIVVQKRVVLLRIQQLEQRGRRVALVPAPNLVHLVDEDERGADVRPSVALDFRDVREPADAEAVELALDRARDGLADGRLADARRADEAEDLPLDAAAQLADGDEFENPVLHVLETVVILVEHLHRVADAVVLRAALAPGDLRQPVEVVSRDVELGRDGLEMRQLVKLLIEDLLDRLRHGELCGFFLELLDQLVLAVAFDAELAPDALHLLHQPVLALPLLDLLLDVLGDLALQLRVHELLLEHDERLVQPVLDVEGLEDLFSFTSAEATAAAKSASLAGSSITLPAEWDIWNVEIWSRKSGFMLAMSLNTLTISDVTALMIGLLRSCGSSEVCDGVAVFCGSISAAVSSNEATTSPVGSVDPSSERFGVVTTCADVESSSSPLVDVFLDSTSVIVAVAVAVAVAVVPSPAVAAVAAAALSFGGSNLDSFIRRCGYSTAVKLCSSPDTGKMLVICAKTPTSCTSSAEEMVSASIFSSLNRKTPTYGCPRFSISWIAAVTDGSRIISGTCGFESRFGFAFLLAASPLLPLFELLLDGGAEEEDPDEAAAPLPDDDFEPPDEVFFESDPDFFAACRSCSSCCCPVVTAASSGVSGSSLSNRTADDVKVRERNRNGGAATTAAVSRARRRAGGERGRQEPRGPAAISVGVERWQHSAGGSSSGRSVMVMPTEGESAGLGLRLMSSVRAVLFEFSDGHRDGGACGIELVTRPPRSNLREHELTDAIEITQSGPLGADDCENATRHPHATPATAIAAAIATFTALLSNRSRPTSTLLPELRSLSGSLFTSFRRRTAAAPPGDQLVLFTSTFSPPGLSTILPAFVSTTLACIVAPSSESSSVPATPAAVTMAARVTLNVASCDESNGVARIETNAMNRLPVVPASSPASVTPPLVPGGTLRRGL